MNRRQSLEKGILSPPGPFLTPSPSPSVQHSPRLQQSPSQSPFQQDVLLVTNNNQNFINTFNTTQEQDRKSGTPNRRLSLNHISPNAGTIAYRPSPTQSPAGITTLSNVGNEFNTTLIGSNNISLNKKGKRTPQHAGQYGSTSNSCSPKASKKAMGLMGSPIASPSPSPTPNSQPIIQQFPIINSNNSIVFMQQPSPSQRASIIQTSNAHQNHVYASSSNVVAGTVKHNKTPQQILPKPAGLTVTSNSSTFSSSLSTPSMITSATSTKQIVTQSKMAIVQQSNQTHQFQSPPHQSQQLMTNNSSGNSSPSPQPHQVTQTGSILLPSGAQPLLLNQMPVLVQQNTPQGVQLILRPPSAPQLATPGLVIHNRPAQIQQHQPQQLLRILNTNGAMQLTAANATPTFIVSSQANIIQQNLQSIKAPTGGSNQLNQISGIQQAQQQTQRQPQQIITNSHILGQSVAQIQNLQLNGNITQLQMANGMNGQFIQQLPAQFQQNLGGFNQIQPIGSQLSAITNATFQSPSSSNSSQNDIGQTVVSTPNQLQFTSNQQNNITVTQGAQIISPVATPQPQMMQSEQSILSSSPSIAYNTQPQTAVILTGDKQIHGISSPPPQLSNFSIIHQSGTNEMITLDMSQHQQTQRVQPTKAARKPKKSKKQKALEAAQQKQQEQQQFQQVQMTQSHVEQTTVMMSPTRNSQAPTGKLDLANVMKLCGIMEDDDFMDSDDQPTETMEGQAEQETIHIPANCNGGENNPTDIMITIPGGSADQPFTFTIPSSSLEKSDGTLIQGSDGKMSNNVPLMIRFDPSDTQNGGQPYTISIPNFTEDNVTDEGKGVEVVSSTSSSNSMCVPSFVNSVLNSSVTPTIQSQINEIQNQLMGLPPVASTKVTTKAPRQKKQSTKKTKKQVEKLIEVPTQIGNIQISQIDGTSTKTALGNKNINNQIQIMPILEKNVSGDNHSGQIIEKHKMQIPVMQQTISQQNNQQHNSQQHHQNHHNSQGTQSNSVPSQVNINVQQNQLINVTNNLQMQVIANPQQQQHNSGATPAHAPPTSSSGHQTQPHNTVVTSQALNTQNLIGNIINAQQGQQTGNIIIQGGNFNQQQQQNLPANIQVNIQNQTIANNIITTAPVNHNNQQHQQQHHQQQQQQQQQPTAQSILSQLTGNLVLSLSEDGRLILRHDPNIPQDAQSQMILQTILTGALGNVSLINEPLKTPMPQLNHQQPQQQHVIGSNGKIQHVSSVQNKNVIISSQAQPQMQSHQQQMFNNVMHSHTMPGHVIHNTSQQIQVQSNKTDSSNNQQQVVMPNPNILKFVELPKIQPNQQLFSLNTITNEITQLNPNQTTAALSPMERLLIVPSGINAQQLAQCLSQGQIHFNNIGQAPTTDPNKVQQQLQIQQQQQQNQMTVSNKSSNIQKVNQFIKKEPTEPKQKKPRGKKAKLLEEQQKFEIKKEPMIQSPPPMKVITDTKFIKASTITTSTVTTTMNTGSKNTITISPNPTLVVNPPKVTPKVVQTNNSPKMNMKHNSISVIPTNTINKQGAIKGGKNNQIKTAMTPQLSPIVSQQQAPPPLVSVNQAPMPRVQTIQLTPQKQQSLKNVQMSIQQLSAKLQNKNLLATLTADVDPNNPAHNNPLPVLNNINTMSDSDIYNALQRLFVEQQKILATGKIIPTIPAAAAAAVSPQLNHSSAQQPQRNIQNSTQPIFASNNFNIVAPVPSTSSSISSPYSSGNSQTNSSPIQVNSPVVKQEPLCSASTSSSQPPPLVVSTPIQMQIKTEILLSPTSVPVTTSPPATGSIIISPKYTTATNKITIDPPKEQKLFVEHKKELVVQLPDANIEAENLIKQQRMSAAIEANRKLKITRSSLFERQICVDQDGCTRPEYKTDFYSKEDAVKRLIRYHCLYDEVKNEHDPSEEYKFEEQAKMFIASYNVMQKKYQHLLMKQSQQQAPTSELMMLDRLRVADLKDEIVSMQAELNSVLFEQHQKSQTVIKVEPLPLQCQQNMVQQLPKIVQTPVLSQTPTPIFPHSPQLSPRIHQNVPILQEPSQLLKAKQEQKLFESIKNEKVKVEIPEAGKSFVFSPTFHCQVSPTPKSPTTSHQQQQQQQPKLTKFDKLKNDSYNVVSHAQPSQSQVHNSSVSKPQPQVKQAEMKEELENFDIESEIRPNLIMKKYESQTHQTPVATPTVTKKPTKLKEKEREFSPHGDYFNPKIGATSKSKGEVVKNDGSYDEWLSIQKELNMQLTSSNASTSRKETKSSKIQAKILENDLSEIFEHRSSPKSVEKQLDDLFSSASKSNELLASPSPLTEFFHVDGSNLSEKTVENRLEALFGGTEEDSRKSTQQDLVETRLEQLFQGSVAENDESALDNASFLYKNTDMTYEMIQKQIHVSTSSGENANASNSNKRQWSGTCDIFAPTNSSMMFPASSSPSSKRACTTVPSVAFDNKWIDDSFDFATEIMSTESPSNDIEKHRNWNGNIDHQETMISGLQSPHQDQFHLPTGNEQHQNLDQNMQQNINMMPRQDQLMETGEIPNMNYDDVDDISRQVQNAIDSILNLQSSDPLHYQLDSSFLELNTITASSGAPNSPMNIQHSHSHPVHHSQHHNQYQQMHSRTDHQINLLHEFNTQKPSNMPKRKYSRLDDIGDCLIGGSSLDDSPSALVLNEPHSVESSSASVGEFVNNLLNCEEKSITTS